MPFQPVFLWTDILIALLLTSLIFSLLYALKKEHLRAPLKSIRKRPMAMGALVVLSCYLLVGLTDSLHFRSKLEGKGGEEAQYAPEVLSLLDLFAGTMRTHTEKTYSAPLAIEAYTKETVEDDSGKKAQIYPRLLYGGKGLKNPTDRFSDIALTAATGALKGLLTSLLLAAVGLFFLRRFHQTSFMAVADGILHGRYDTAWRTLFFTTGFLVVFAFILAALSARYHLFGTDKVGQDVLYLSLKAIRTGLVIGTLTTLIMLPFAALLGIGAGYFKGGIDDLIQYLYTTLSSVPGVLLIAAAVLILQLYMDTHADSFRTIAERADIRLFFLCLILGTTGWIGLCRLLRGETLKLSQMEYVQAAWALGMGHGQIIFRHILPNVIHIILIASVLDFSSLVLAEAVLSYVGIGVDPAMISWGNMINSARLEMARRLSGGRWWRSLS